MASYLEKIISAAERHGQLSEPDMEVGDLQELARELWAALTPEQQKSFAKRAKQLRTCPNIDWDEFIEQWLGE